MSYFKHNIYKYEKTLPYMKGNGLKSIISLLILSFFITSVSAGNIIFRNGNFTAENMTSNYHSINVQRPGEGLTIAGAQAQSNSPALGFKNETSILANLGLALAAGHYSSIAQTGDLVIRVIKGNIIWAINESDNLLFSENRKNINITNNVSAKSGYFSERVTSPYFIGDGSQLTNLPSTGTLTGQGISGYISRWNSTTGLNSSAIFQSGSKIGIGLTTPDHILTIWNGNATGGIKVTTNEGTDIRSQILIAGNGTNGRGTLNIMGGHTGFTGSQIADGAATLLLSGAINELNPLTYAFVNHPGVGLLKLDVSNNRSGSQLNGIMSWKSDGKVGIGTVNPQEKFHVNGSVIVNGVVNASSYVGLNFSTQDLTVLDRIFGKKLRLDDSQAGVALSATTFDVTTTLVSIFGIPLIKMTGGNGTLNVGGIANGLYILPTDTANSQLSLGNASFTGNWVFTNNVAQQTLELNAQDNVASTYLDSYKIALRNPLNNTKDICVTGGNCLNKSLTVESQWTRVNRSVIYWNSTAWVPLNKTPTTNQALVYCNNGGLSWIDNTAGVCPL